MMNPVSVDVKDMLEGETILGLVFSENLFVGREPATPNNCVTVYDPPGGSVDITLNAKEEPYYRHDFQVRVRNVSYMAAWEKAEAIMNVLHGWANEVYGEVFYAAILCTTPPTLLTWDENNRVVFIVNFMAHRRHGG